MGVYCRWVKRLTDLQILGSSARDIALPQAPSRYKGKRRNGRAEEMVGNMEWRKGRECRM